MAPSPTPRQPSPAKPPQPPQPPQKPQPAPTPPPAPKAANVSITVSGWVGTTTAIPAAIENYVTDYVNSSGSNIVHTFRA